jgi:hypothetical protein
MGQEVLLDRDGQKIYAELWHPNASDPGADPQRIPLVIMAHGFGGSHRWAYDYAPAFEDMGFAVLSMDFCGGAVGSRSTGATTDMSIMTELADLEAVLDWAREQPNIDPDRVILMGQSQGAAVCAMLADKRPQDVRAMVLCYPAFSIHDDMVRRYGDKSTLPDTFTMWMPLGRRFAEDAIAYDFYEHMGAFEGQVLIIHGTDDSVVPLSYSERATGAFAHARLEVIEGGRHGFVGRARRRAVMLSSTFLVANA